MSTVTLPRSVFARWIDDAAVFPPAQLPVAQALREHLELRAGEHADLIGPLLAGTGHVADLIAAAQSKSHADSHADSHAESDPDADSAPRLDEPRLDDTGQGLQQARVPVGVIARAGTPVEDLLAAAAAVRADPNLELASVEVSATEQDWPRTLDLDVPVAVELAPSDDEAGYPVLADLHRARLQGHSVIAKLRTQAVAPRGAPTATELAAFLVATREQSVPFKLTGGLHHALPHGAGEAAEHGLLNVLASAGSLVGASSAGGSSAGVGTARDLVDILTTTEPEPLLAAIAGWSAQDHTAVRAAFRSFGCCAVTDPIGEFTTLGLLPGRA